MKIKISYSISVEKEIEIAPADYCRMRANTDSRPDIFPPDSFHREISMDETSENELYIFCRNHDKKG